MEEWRNPYTLRIVPRAGRTKGGLRLDARAMVFRGGDGGPVIRPKDADHSELFNRITSTDPDLRMPAEAEPLDEASVRLLKQWIDGGAVWEETDEDRAASVDDRLNHWALQPVKNVPPPDITDAASAVDAFVKQKLTEHGLMRFTSVDHGLCTTHASSFRCNAG